MRTAPARTLKLLLLPLLPLNALSCLLYLPQPMRYPLQSMLGFTPLGCLPHPRQQQGCCRARGLPLCTGVQSPLLSWAVGACLAAAEQGAQAGVTQSPCWERYSAALDELCPLGWQQQGRGAEWVPSGVGGWLFACWTQSWPPVLGEEGAEQAGTELVPSSSSLPPRDVAPYFGGWRHLLTLLCLLALAQSLFSQFNLLLSAQYVTVEQLSGILGHFHPVAASPLACTPPSPSSPSGCITPPPLPSLSSPSVSAEVCALFPSLCSSALPGR